MTTHAFPRTHTLDVERLVVHDATADELSLLRSLLRQLATSPTGQRLLLEATRRSLTIRFASSEELAHGGGSGPAAGWYDPNHAQIVLGRTQRRDLQLTTLAHELQHFVDHALGWGTGATVQCEVRANQTEAFVIRELGLAERTWGLTSTGGIRHSEDIAAEVRAHPLYARNGEELPRADGRLHPLLENRDLLPIGMQLTYGGSGGLTVGPVAGPRHVAPIAAQTHAAAPMRLTSRAAASPTTWTGSTAWHVEQPPMLAALDSVRASRC